MPCPEDQVVAGGRTTCEACPVRQAAIEGVNRRCGCADGFHNASEQLSVCFDRGYAVGQLEAAVADHHTELSAGQFCNPCPTDAFGQGCFDCIKGMYPTVSAGYTIPQLPSVGFRRLLQDGQQIQLAFRCHVKLELAQVRCPANPAAPGQCTLGYQGYLCQTCAKGYGMVVSQRCEPCAEAGFTTRSLIILLAIIASITLVVGMGIKHWHKFPFKLAVRCAFQPIRIVITYAQVTSQLGDVLSYQYPAAFAEIVDAVRPIMDVRFHIRRLRSSSV
eukprot:COSAG02_NODE_1754_length_11053_cov_1.832390_2_plen_275_part_00